jgi:hypothetical protein
MLPTCPAGATTEVGVVRAEYVHGRPLGGSAGAQEHPPPYVEDTDDGARPPQGVPVPSVVQTRNGSSKGSHSSNVPLGVPNSGP